MRKEAVADRLELRGGAWATMSILLTALAFLFLAAVNQSKMDGYILAFLLPLLVGALLPKDQRAYGEAVTAGLAKPMFGTIALAVIFASLAGNLVGQSGLIQTIANAAVLTGVTGKHFVAMTFVLTCLISFSTGTSVGTYFVVIPIAFPAGVLLETDPVFLIGSIAAGAAFGDNLAPISDTTIASATTQEMDVGGVVRSRTKYSLPAALIALLAYLTLCPGAVANAAVPAQPLQPKTLLMLVVPALIIALCFQRRHLITTLAIGTMAGLAIGLTAGIFTPTQLLSFPKPFEARGILVDSLTAAMPTLAFLMVVFPFLNVMEASGALDALGRGIAGLAKGPRSVEVVTVLATGLLSMVTGVISVAILSVGDIVRKLGLEFRVDGYRRANLMDCAGASFCFIVPWTVHAIVPAMLAAASPGAGRSVSPADVSLHNFYSWAMLLVLIVSIVSGYGRRFVPDAKR